MITDAIHDYVAGQLSGLWSLPKPQRRARLAELRRGVGHQPGDLPALWGSFLQELPKELWGRETAAGECREPSEAEWAVYLALTLYALHQQGEENVSMNEKGCTLGRAVRLLAQNSAAAAQDWTESSVLRRFNALATADSMPEVSHYLRGMVQLFRGNEPKLKLDYPRLAVELYRFQLPDTHSPRRSASDDPKASVGSPLASTFSSARSVAESLPMSLASNERPSLSFTLSFEAPSTTWLFVTI